MDDKDIKKRFVGEYKKNPGKFYPTKTLREKGFIRKKCKCGRFFWNKNEKRKVCGDPACVGGYKFIHNSPAKKKLNYIDTWKSFSNYFRKLGYKNINRYPVLAVWRDDIPFVEASIDDFIPHVVEGESKPPAKSLVVPQLCLRFNDLDNVGLTGAHYSLFSMIGQHKFEKPENYNPDEYLKHLLGWFKDCIGLEYKEITLHEDIWAGSGKFGPSMEIFSRGLELANQVYMQYQLAPDGDGYKELDLKVLDMGMGHERIPWFTQGESTSYKTTFPGVIKKLQKASGLKSDEELFRRFLPFASYLNVDEVEDLNKTWMFVASKLGVDLDELRSRIIPLADLYALAEHARALLVAITDGGLPSNVGGGHNLRVLLRRGLEIIRKYNWDLSLEKICRWHSEELKEIYPELSKNLDTVYEILAVEKEKWVKSREMAGRVLKKLEKGVSEKELLKLYDSQGIGPEVLREKGFENIPGDFYKKVARLHEDEKETKKTGEATGLELSEVKKTRPLYLKDYKKTKFEGEVLDILNKYVILDRSAFYPKSGGQEGDTGYLDGSRVIKTFKQGDIIIHKMKHGPGFKKGEKIKGKVDKNRRIQLTQHHTATHIINLSARKVLGKHVRQAGAEKTAKKARIDITHYKLPTPEEMEKIEEEANKVIIKNIGVIKEIMERDRAEKKYGFNIYQGGAVPGKELRIISIGEDHEACGGTHLNHTDEAGKIIITDVNKIQDAVVRIEFVAGEVAKRLEESSKRKVEEISKVLGTEEVLKGVKNLLEKRKEIEKSRRKARRKYQKGIAEKVNFKEVKGVKFLVEVLKGDTEDLKRISETLSGKNTLIVLFGKNTKKIHMFASAGRDVLKRGVDVGSLVKEICEKLDGKGGGRKNLGQGYCSAEPKKSDIEGIVYEKLQDT